MITNLEIQHFKSVKNVKMKCNQYNIFIGEPNSGKSNILEVLGLLSAWGNNESLKSYIRFKNMTNLFYDDLIDRNIKLNLNDFHIELKYNYDQFILSCEESHKAIHYTHDGQNTGGSSGSGKRNQDFQELIKQINFFKFKDISIFDGINPGSLFPPHGRNLFAVVYSNEKYRKIMKDFVETFGFKLVFRPQEKTFELQKQEKDIIISYPYILASDTVKNIIYYLFAIISNKNSTLVFEEPEAHAFPYYTKFIAEKIASEKTNQYFIVTHNPYFLASILEKTPKDLINVYVTYFQDFQTKVYLLKEKQIQRILDDDLDPFFDIKSFYGE